MSYAPIALFTYNRPDKTQRVLESLMQNAEAKDSDLFIFSDGPKNEKAVEGVQKNREYIHQVQESSKELRWFKSVTIIEREKNWGLANSLIAGITEVINKYGRVIVVEDDLILSPYFLKFMNGGLEKYKDEDKVGAISAYLQPTGIENPNTFFLTYFNCWGWATWKRSWDLLEIDSVKLLKALRFKRNRFDVGNSIGNYGMLYCQKMGLVDSWYIRYYASLYLNGKLVLYPSSPLTINVGLDGSGVHCGVIDGITHIRNVSFSPIKIDDILVENNTEVYEALKKECIASDGRSNILRAYHDLKCYVRRLINLDCR